jgi:hypothetical protein
MPFEQSINRRRGFDMAAVRLIQVSLSVVIVGGLTIERRYIRILHVVERNIPRLRQLGVAIDGNIAPPSAALANSLAGDLRA